MALRRGRFRATDIGLRNDARQLASCNRKAARCQVACDVALISAPAPSRASTSTAQWFEDVAHALDRRLTELGEVHPRLDGPTTPSYTFFASQLHLRAMSTLATWGVATNRFARSVARRTWRAWTSSRSNASGRPSSASSSAAAPRDRSWVHPLTRIFHTPHHRSRPETVREGIPRSTIEPLRPGKRYWPLLPG